MHLFLSIERIITGGERCTLLIHVGLVDCLASWLLTVSRSERLERLNCSEVGILTMRTAAANHLLR
jgi:hypothetical protein